MKLRAGTAVLAAANLAAGAVALVAGVPPGGVDDVGAVAAAASIVVGPEAAPATVLVLSQHPLLATTTTTAPPTTTTTAAARVRTLARGVEPSGAARRAVSTGYCLEGTTASGREVGPGTVAMNGVPLGSRWYVHDGPFAGTTLEVADRIGHGTDFDIWFEHCSDAMAYGRRTITVERMG